MVPRESAPEPARAASGAGSQAARTLRLLRPLRKRAAAMDTLVVTASLTDIDPQVWLADVLACIAELPRTQMRESLPWN